MAQTLPTDEDFAAPDWLTSAGNALPWFFWYLGFNPTTGVSTSAGDGASYPWRAAAELESLGRQELYTESVSPIMPALLTDTSATGQTAQRSVLCREEDSTAVEDIDFKVVFGLRQTGGGTQGGAFGGTGTASPTAGGRYPFPKGDLDSTNINTDGNLFTGGFTNAGNWSTGAGSRPRLPGGTANTWAMWLGNSLFFRAGGGNPLVTYDATPGVQSRAWWCTHVAHYAFCAYPVINSGADRVDLYLELWQVKFSGGGATDGTARRLIQQIVDGGANQIDFSKPYFLRVTCDNDATPDPNFTAFIGEYKQAGAANLSEAQVFKDGVFGNNTYTVGTNVTHTSSTGNVKDAHADKITAYADKSFGWGMGRDRTVNVTPKVDPDGTSTTPQWMSGLEGIYSVEISDVSAGTVLYRDEFARAVTGGGPAPDIINPVVGLFGNYGNQANGLFTFDGYAQEFGQGNEGVRRMMLWTDSQTDTTGANDFVTLDYDADNSSTEGSMVLDVVRSFVHERPSTQFFNHHRSIEFKPGDENPSGGTAELSAISYELGVGLRGYRDGSRVAGIVAYLSWNTDAEDTITYAALTIAARNALYDDTDPASDKTVIIARKKWSTSAEVTAFIAAYPLYNGNFHTLDFKAETYASATSPEAAAEYHVELDGAPIELDDTTVAIQSGTVSPYPVVQPGPAYWYGNTEGFFFWSDAPELQETTAYRNYDPFQAKNWTEGSLTADPVAFLGVAGPDGMASIVVSGEGTAVGALNTSSGALGITGGGVWDVEVTVNVDSAWPIRRIPFDSGHTYTSPAASKARRRWRVSVRAADLAVYQSLQTFYNSHDGMEIPFSFVVPIPDDGTEAGHTAEASETVTAWFAEDALQVSEVGPQIYDISFGVEEELVP